MNSAAEVSANVHTALARAPPAVHPWRDAAAHMATRAHRAQASLGGPRD